MHTFHQYPGGIIALTSFGMKMPKQWLILALISFAVSCTKTDPVSPGIPTAPLVTAPGVPDGAAVTKTIGADGGTLTSADGNMNITIPAGALSGDKAITVQPVTRKLPDGYGKVYRLTPHDISFQQPVTIRLRYNEDSIKNTVPELLGIAYQDQQGKWFHAAAPVPDKVSHTLTTTTTHFSDWGIISYLYIQPNEPLVQPGAHITLKVMGVIPESAPDADVVPINEGDAVNQPFMVSPGQLGSWNYSGEGSLQGDGNKAYYQAPGSVPRINPEAVSIEVKSKGKGQFLLVSNITIDQEFHIDYLQVDETERHAGGLDYQSRLWIYGSFGEDPGKGRRNVKINNSEVTVALWTPGMIACDIPTVGPSSSGMVVITSGKNTAGKMLNEWVVDMFYNQKQSPDGALTKKVNIVLHLRGDADGFFRQGQVPMVHETDLHTYNKGIIEMPAGSFTSHVTADACGDYTVAWDAIHDLIIDRKKDTDPGNDRLRGEVINQPDGFDIKIRLMAEDVLMTHRRFADCVSGSTLDHVREYIQIEGFHDQTIPLRFFKSGDKTFIKAGQLPVRTGSPAAGLYWDAQDYNPSQFTTSLCWNEAAPKF